MTVETPKPFCQIRISDLRIWVHLGCGDEEKFHPQLVSFDIALSFKSPPEGMKTDRLEDTVCYLETVQSIQTLCQNRAFNLIEHLTAEVYNAVNQALGEHRQSITMIHVTMRKMAPPVPGVHGGVSFMYHASPQSHTIT